jgi:hypothetical protein
VRCADRGEGGDGRNKRTGEARDGGDTREIETEPMTSGTHLSGRTKKEAEAILALILGRDIYMWR